MTTRFVTGFAGWLLSAGCAPPPDGGAEDSDLVLAPSRWTVASLRVDAPIGELVRVAPALVVSPPTPGEDLLFLQDPVTGDGAVLGRSGHVPGWPPPVGTRLDVRARFVGPRLAPVLWVDGSGLTPLGAGAPILASVDAPLNLVTRAFEITGGADPSARASTADDLGMDGVFGVPLPGWGATGAVTGVVLADGAIAPRSAEDIALDVPGLAGPEPVGVDDVRQGSVPAGYPVVVEGVQAAPWSRDGRWTVVQDATGRGLWVDAEGWAFPRDTLPGQAVRWTGAVAAGPGHPVLRVWSPAEPLGGVAVVVRDPTGRVGDVLQTDALGLGPPDPRGERTDSQGRVFDDRFVDLSSAPADLRVTGIVVGDGVSGTRLAVVAIDAVLTP